MFTDSVQRAQLFTRWLSECCCTPQAGIKPPTFVLFVNDPELFPDDYKKYIERQLRENIGFPGTPLRLYWRGKQGGWGKGVDAK